tara:strand:- start:806 stop:1795 length:990 start_codon:yes stop_codon:yes gene_type:complete
MFRLAQYLLPPLRWIRALHLLTEGVRVHPTALFLGRKRQLSCAKGVKLGSQVSIDPGSDGKVLIESDVWISSGVEMQTQSLISIGKGTSIQRRSTVNGSVRIGRGCIIAPNVFISSGTHPFREIPHLPIRKQENRLSKSDRNLDRFDRAVWIQDDCWLGTNVVICQDVTVGKGSVIGANSVVNKDVPPYSVVAGCPAKIVGNRLDWAPGFSIDVSLEEDHPYLLNAHLVQTDSGYVALLSPGVDLLAALRKPEKKFIISIDWSCSDSFFWVFANQKIHQDSGHGRFNIPSNDLFCIDNIVYCQLAVKSQMNKPALVEVKCISIESTNLL